MTQGEIAAILVRLDYQDEAIGEIKADVSEILKHAKETNGRVTELEQDRRVREEIAAQRSQRLKSWSAVGLVVLGSGIGLIPVIVGALHG